MTQRSDRYPRRFALLFAAILTLAPTAQARIWNPLAPMNVPRAHFAAAAIDGKIYAVSGQTENSAAGEALTPTTEMYDPATDTWSFRADFPVAERGLSAAVLDGILYVTGGGASTPLPGVFLYAYDPTTDTWSQKADRPIGGFGPAMVALGGKLYVIGGLTWTPEGTEFAGTTTLLAYDPATDTWEQLAAMPVPGAQLAAATLGGQIYVFGLGSEDDFTGDIPIYRYDPTTDTWSTVASLLTDRRRLGAVTANGTLYALGGEGCGGPCTEVEQYDPATDTWTAAGSTPLRTGRWDFATARIGDKIYAIGGLARPERNSATPLVEVQNLSHPLVTRADQFHVAAGSDQPLPLNIDLQLDLPTGATVPTLSLDLTAFGQSQPAPLQHTGNGRFVGQASIVPPATKGLYDLPVQIGATDPEVLYRLPLAALPADLEIFAAALTSDWALDFNSRVTPTPAPFAGRDALALAGSGAWRMTILAPAPVDLFGYEALGFDFHPANYTLDEGDAPRLQLGRSNLLDKIDLDTNEWQRVVVPVDQLGLPDGAPLSQLQFAGNLEGTFYLGDIRLVAQEPPPTPPTAVVESRDETTPDNAALDQNYPNPFNAGTVIRFALPQASAVDLTVFNLAGQKVAQLVAGPRPAGTYTLRWDGTDDAGRPLASGVYLYQLQAGNLIQTRKLVLVK